MSSVYHTGCGNCLHDKGCKLVVNSCDDAVFSTPRFFFAVQLRMQSIFSYPADFFWLKLRHIVRWSLRMKPLRQVMFNRGLGKYYKMFYFLSPTNFPFKVLLYCEWNNKTYTLFLSRSIKHCFYRLIITFLIIVIN